ncbi:MAG: ABC transporter substrate-binding protein [Candidatus Omnitrophota bacterium]
MDFTKLLRLPILLVVFLFISLVSPVSAEDYKPQAGRSGGNLILSTTSDPKSFNPILAKETSTTAVTGLIFEGLTRTNGITLEVEPNLAHAWLVSKDGKEITFYLRKGLRWSDGVPLTGDDIVFTFNELIYNPDIPNSARDIFTVEGKQFKVEKIDDYAVKFTLPTVFAPFLMSMSQEILPKHKLEKAAKDGKFNFTWGTDASPADVTGTGPFKLAKYRPGEDVILERNPYYWKRDAKSRRLPYLDKVIFVIVQSPDVAVLKFLEGEIDYYGMRGADFPILKPREKEKNFTVYNTGPAFGSDFLVFNLNPDINIMNQKPFFDPIKLSWFSNLDFRKVVAHALDKKKMIEIVLNGLGFDQDGPMSPSSGFFYNPGLTRYEYDLKKAKEILRDAGFIDRNLDGFIEDRKGRTVEFNLLTNSGNTERIQIAGIIRKDLENLGMKVNLLSLEFNNLVTKLDSTFDWDAILLGLTGGIEPHFSRNVWHSRGQLHLWHPKQIKPLTKWEEEIDNIFDKGVQELDRDKRKVFYDRWQEIVSQELPVIYTVLPASIFAVKNKFGNLYPTSYGGAFHNIEEIFIKSSE